ARGEVSREGTACSLVAPDRILQGAPLSTREARVTFKRFVCIVLLVVLTAVVVRPARAEAIDPQLVLIIVGAGIAVIALIAVVIIANASEGRRRSAAASTAAGASTVVVFQTTAIESP